MGHVACIWKILNMYEIVNGNSEGNRSLGRSRNSREKNIKLNLEDISCESVDWIQLTQNVVTWRSVLDMEMNL